MLDLAKIASINYYTDQVAQSLEDYYVGAGEAPGDPTVDADLDAAGHAPPGEADEQLTGWLARSRAERMAHDVGDPPPSLTPAGGVEL